MLMVWLASLCVILPAMTYADANDELAACRRIIVRLFEIERLVGVDSCNIERLLD